MRIAALVPTYRRRNSALHAARAAVVIIYLGAVCVAAFVFSQPLVLSGLMLALLAVAALAGSLKDLRPFLLLALTVGLLIAVVNALVSDQGLTVLIRGPHVPVLGNIDVTLEGCVYGLLMGLRVAVVMVVAGVYTVAVDPDRVLRLFRRVGFRSALTATVATRLVPTLGRDAQRLSEAYRCRPDVSGNRGRAGAIRSRAPVLRALLIGSLDRAVDVAMALETRGFGRGRPSSGIADRWSANDVAFAFAGVLLLAVTIAASVTGMGDIHVYPRVGEIANGGDLALALTLVLVLLLPIVIGRARDVRYPGRI